MPTERALGWPWERKLCAKFLFHHLIIWGLIYSGFPLLSIHLGHKYLQQLEPAETSSHKPLPQTFSSLVFNPIPSKSLTICQTTGHVYEPMAFSYSRHGGLPDMPLQIPPLRRIFVHHCLLGSPLYGAEVG